LSGKHRSAGFPFDNLTRGFGVKFYGLDALPDACQQKYTHWASSSASILTPVKARGIIPFCAHSQTPVPFDTINNNYKPKLKMEEIQLHTLLLNLFTETSYSCLQQASIE